MRSIVWTMVFVSLLAVGRGSAQLVDGHLVISVQTGGLFPAKGAVLHFDPRAPGLTTTLGTAVQSQHYHSWLRMAPDNRNVVVGESLSGASGSLISLDPSGVRTTIVRGVPGEFRGFELDGDNTWVIAAGSNFLWGVDHGTGALKSFSLASPWPGSLFNEMCIVREQGVTYAVANYTRVVGSVPKIWSIDRNGVVVTLLQTNPNPLSELNGIEWEPRRGQFLTTDFAGPNSPIPEPNGVEVNLVTVGGTVSTLFSMGTAGARILQDDTAWIAGVARQPTTLQAVFRYDLGQNSVVSIVRPATTWTITGVEVYGSRALTCNGQGGPSATVGIQINSKRTGAGGATYQIACSLARRPGVKLPNGEWIHLDVTDPLFTLTARNQVQSIFQSFSGTLDPFGSAKAQVKLPSYFPANVGLTVFCAAVIIQQGQVLQVTNTHWFEL